MFLSKDSPKSFYVYGLVMFLVLSMNQQRYSFQPALQDTQWSLPQTIPLYNPETVPPIMVADQNRTVHAFSSQWIGDGNSESFRAIIYNRWTLGQGWTSPIDIILSPYKEARITDVHLDKEGTFHVVFFGGDETNADIYYSKAPAAIADSSRSWSPPLLIGENANDPESAVLTEDNEGTLHAIYYGRQLGNGLYVVNSNDHGENWSDSTPIFLSQSDEPNITLLQVIKGDSGWLHAIWSVYNVAGQGRGIFYTRSENGNEWDEPTLLADAQNGLGTQTPRIIEHKGILIALYNMTPKITMRRSFNGGETWDDPSVIFPRHVGVNGTLSLVIDSNNDLHLFFGQRITGSPDIHGMWHSTLVDNRWTEPEAVIKGPRVVDALTEKSFDPSLAHGIVSQGNVLLVTWIQDPDPGIKPNGVWFSYKVVNAPELPLKSLQVAPKVGTTASPDALPTPVLLSEPTHSLPSMLQGQSQSSPSMSLIIGIVVVLILLLGVIVPYILNHR